MFIIPSSQADYLLGGQYSRVEIARSLGLKPDELTNGNLIRIDILKPLEHNLRMPVTGNQYHRPNTGLTPAGFTESVIDSIPRNDPNIRVNNLGD